MRNIVRALPFLVVAAAAACSSPTAPERVEAPTSFSADCLGGGPTSGGGFKPCT